MRNMIAGIKERLRSHTAFTFFYILFLAVGFLVYTDYGVSWDESISRNDNGIFNYNFIGNGDSTPLLTGLEKYHGPAFEILLVAIEKVFSLKDMQDIYFMRHLVTFLIFAIAVLFFYMLCIKNIKSHWLAFVGTAFLVFSPRIFAESFYNSKDLVFMCFMIINLYTTIRFLEKKNFRTALFHAIISAFTIDIRILGIIIPCFTLLILLIDFIKTPGDRRKVFFSSLIYFFFLIGAMILFWPVLWLGPVKHFMLAIQEMSKYPWLGEVFYRGENFRGTDLPWHYIPFWILISTPLLYIGLFLTGIFFLIRKFFQRNNITNFEWLNLYTFFFPILAIILLHSIVYDGWRHLYFIYPSFLFIALFGLESIFKIIKVNHLNKLIKSSVIIYIVYIGYIMVVLHPYEHLYFNIIAGKSLQETRKKFELDYWGLSYKQGLEYILKNDPSPNIVISAVNNHPVKNNTFLFTEEQRTRISFTDDDELADYFITTHRSNYTPYNYTPEFNIIRDNGIILSVYNFKEKKEILLNDKNKTGYYKNTYEDSIECWTKGKIIYDSTAYSGNYTELLNPSIPYSSSFYCNPLKDFLNQGNSRNYMTAGFQIKTASSFDILIIFQLDTGESKTVEWRAEKMQSSLKNKWIRRDFRILIPKFNTSNQSIKFYIWNLNKNTFTIDDTEINFYSISEDEFKSIML